MHIKEEILWPDGRVPYEVDQCPPALIARIALAMDEWTNRTGIEFVLRTPENGSAYEDYVRFVPGASCSSHQGRAGGRQDLRLTPKPRVGVIMHEIGHLLGLTHEHNRADRDDHIKINWDNILPAAVENFHKATTGDLIRDYYDVTSIMHYSRLAYTRNRGETITPISSEASRQLLGQRRRLSDGDAQAVQLLYGTRGSEAYTQSPKTGELR